VWGSGAGSELLAQVPIGSTLNRIRFSWGFGGVTSSDVDIVTGMANIMLFGIVTTVGNGSESVPDARDAPNDADPPLKRWLWWEARAPQVFGYDGESGLITWQSSPNQEIVDTHAQVSTSAGIPAGDTLNVWMSFRGAATWDSSGWAKLWGAASVLYGA
jgi:hypothetical protein